MSVDTNSLLRELQEMEDQRDAVEARLARIETANEESIPWNIVKRLSRGANPVAVWREYRGLSRSELAAASRMTETDIEAIEAGRSDPGLQVMAPIAKALRVDIEDLVPASQD